MKCAYMKVKVPGGFRQCKNDGSKKWVDGKMYCGPHHDKLARENPNAVGQPLAIIDNGKRVGTHVPGEGNTIQEDLGLDEFTDAALPDEKDLKMEGDKLEERLKDKLNISLFDAMVTGRSIEGFDDGIIMRPNLVVIKRDDYFIVAGSGSRELQTARKGVKQAVMDFLGEWLPYLKEKYGDKLVIMSGMAEGFDKALAKAALKHGIKLWCAVPNRGYGNYYWRKTSLTKQDRLWEFDAILEQAWEVTFIMEEVHKATGSGVFYNAGTNSLSWERSHGKHTNFIRNDFMVEMGHAFVVYDPSTRGTADAYKSMRKTGKPIRLVNIEGQK
jgi:hypothetical protein